jgi:hypothetical protein
MLTKKLLDVATKFECNICDYSTGKTSSYTKHRLTAKHIRLTSVDAKSTTSYQCSCGKEFNQRQGLWRHKQKCELLSPTIQDDQKVADTTSTNNSIEMITLFKQQNDLIIELVRENADFKELLIDQNKQMIELAKNAGHNTTNNTTNNKFNLNFFLNETCKDAITMSDFINSIEVTLEDFIQTGNIGFVDGISKVMVERIKVMDLHTRPMHCTDLKRETLYIKNNDKWEKEDNDKTLLRKAVKNIANKNYNKLSTWYNNSKPAVEIIGSEDCENYFKYYKAALGGYDKEEDKKFEEKIIKNVLKEVLLNKDAVERKKEG